MKDKLKQEIDAYLEEVVPKLVAEAYGKMRMKEHQYKINDLENEIRVCKGLYEQSKAYSGPPAPPCVVIHGM